jgi:hypothetical protein
LRLKTSYEILTYQLGWMDLVKNWDDDERAGKEVITPTPNIKWIHINTVAPFTNFRTKIMEKGEVVWTMSLRKLTN